MPSTYNHCKALLSFVQKKGDATLRSVPKYYSKIHKTKKLHAILFDIDLTTS